jgi:hypothetical protein
MDDEVEKVKTDMEKKKILAILPNNQELQGNIYNVKLYSSDREGVDWLYSGLEGNLALIVDFQAKTKYICIYDPTNYEKVFQYELYNGFEKCFEELAPEFRCFEIESGFIGLQFDNQGETEDFERTLNRISTMKNIFTKTKVKENTKAQQEKFQNYCKKLKEIFCEGESKYDENYAEDGTQILRHRNFKVLSNISYDKEKKKFQFGKISEELKEMFLSYGIKKKDLETDLDFAFNLFKKVIVGLGSENKLKNSALDKIEHSFLPPAEREKLRRQEEAAEAKLNIKRTQTKRKAPAKKKTPGGTTKGFAAAKRSSVPLAPPPPPPPPPPPSIANVPQIKTPQGNTKPTVRSSMPQVDVATQIQNMKLKKVVKEEKQDKIQGNNKNFLQNALSTAIMNRRKNLHMHDDDDDEEEDDWD